MIFFFPVGSRSKPIYFLLNYSKLAKDDIICIKRVNSPIYNQVNTLFCNSRAIGSRCQHFN